MGAEEATIAEKTDEIKNGTCFSSGLICGNHIRIEVKDFSQTEKDDEEKAHPSEAEESQFCNNSANHGDNNRAKSGGSPSTEKEQQFQQQQQKLQRARRGHHCRQEEENSPKIAKVATDSSSPRVASQAQQSATPQQQQPSQQRRQQQPPRVDLVGQIIANLDMIERRTAFQHVVAATFRVCSRSQYNMHERSTRTIIWAVSQYLAMTIYCAVVTLVTILSDDFACFVEDCGEAILVMSVACFSLSLCLEHFSVVQIQFFSNLLSGVFLTGTSVYFTVFPPFGLFPVTILLSLLSACVIYAVVLLLAKNEGHEQGKGYGLGLYIYATTAVPSTLFLMSQSLYVLIQSMKFDIEYGEYTVNLLVAMVIGMLISYERFRFLYTLLRGIHERHLRMETFILSLIRKMGRLSEIRRAAASQQTNNPQHHRPEQQGTRRINHVCIDME